MRGNGPKGTLLVPVLAFAVALVSRSWVLDSPIRTDDALFYGRAGPYLSEFRDRIGLFLRGEPLPDWRSDHDAYRGNYRPIDWLLRRMESPDGRVPRSRVGFGIALLLHALTAAAAALIGMRLASARAGLLSGLFVALVPVGAQAHAWLAVRGDVLVACFSGLSVLAALATTRSCRCGWGPGVLSGLGAALALSSKVSGLLAVPLVFLPAILRLRRFSWWFVVGALPMITIGLTLRFIWSGSILPVDYRSAAAPLVDLDAIAAAMPERGPAAASLARTFLGAPWSGIYGASPVTGPLGALILMRRLIPWAASILLVLPFLLRGEKKSLCLLLGWTLLMLVPPWLVWATKNPGYYDRALLPAVLPFGIAMATSVDRALCVGRCAGLTAGVATLVMVLGFAHQDMEIRRVNALCRRNADAKAEFLNAIDEPDGGIVVAAMGHEIRGWQLGIPRVERPGVFLTDLSRLKHGDQNFAGTIEALSVGSPVKRTIILRSLGPGLGFEDVSLPQPCCKIASTDRATGRHSFELRASTGETSLALLLEGPCVMGADYSLSLWSGPHDEGAEAVERMRPIPAGGRRLLVVAPTDLNGRWHSKGRHELEVVGPNAEELSAEWVTYASLQAIEGASTPERMAFDLPRPPGDVLLAEVRVIDPETRYPSIRFFWKPAMGDSKGGRLRLSLAECESALPAGSRDQALEVLRDSRSAFTALISVVTPHGAYRYRAMLSPP